MKKRLLTMLTMVMTLTGSVSAQSEEHLKLHFDFENVSGTSVTDNISGVTAKTMGAAKVVELGSRHVLDLGNSTGYLNMTVETGKVVRQLEDFTVSACYCVSADASLSGNGYFLWAFSQTAANTETVGFYNAYRLNAQRLATSPAGWGSEVGMELGTASTKGRWIHVLYRQSGSKGELFLDGRRMTQASNMPVLKNTFTTNPAYCWIGRAPFSGDSYLKKTMVADFRIYDEAVDDDKVRTLATVATELEREYRYGTPGDATALQQTVAECRSFANGDVSAYAPNAMAELTDLLTVAEEELAAARASQALLDQYEAELTRLMAAAKATSGYQPKHVFAPTDAHGFVHPGGIVSQQDIDRAKALLAAGDERIKRAWNILCANEYSQSTVATWPTPTVVRGGGSGQNYMNCARGAAMAYQNALRWKIGGTKANADAAVRILMQWARECNGLGGDTNISLAAGIYGYEMANAAELMRDYEGWSREDFDEFRRWIIRVFYNPAIDFLRRRHDTWANWRYPNMGERPGHYWSNWGLCNALCVMSIGILCDDVHTYNQGASFYKYDHQGTFKADRSNLDQIVDDGCNEFIGNLVPIVIADDRGPLGYLGQMQESGRDQGHALMALGLALDICQVGLTQGDDLYAYMDDRIAAGLEHVAALNFGGVAASSLPWKNYNYSDCRGYLGSGWLHTAPNEGGKGEFRPYWDRAIGYYEGLRGVKLQYAEKASQAVCPDGGGGNYSQNSGGFDHVGFSTLTSWRPAVTADEAITPLSGDIIYKDVTYKNQTNLGGLKYKYDACPSKAIAADGADITLIPQLPEGTEDTGRWQWETGETTRQLTVKADHSYIYRVTYTAANGQQSQQAFAIAVSGDAPADVITTAVTIDGAEAEADAQGEYTVLSGSSVTMTVSPTTGWTNDYLWDNGQTTNAVTIPALTTSRTYNCQYANQSGAVSEAAFRLNVVDALQYISVSTAESETNEVQVLKGATVTLRLVIPASASASDVTWTGGAQGTDYIIDSVDGDMTVTATFKGKEYTYYVYIKATDYGYYDLLTADKGYKLVASAEELTSLAADHYFVLASDQADLLIGLANAPKNGNKALFFQTPADPVGDLMKLFIIEPYGDAFCLRNVDYDGLLLQTEWNRPDQLRTHDQPLACEWTRLLLTYSDGSWTVENGRYPGNWLGLWTPANGYRDGEEIGCNKTGNDISRLQIFAIEKKVFNYDYLTTNVSPETGEADATPLIANPQFTGNGYGWAISGSWGNQRYNGAVEVWHSTNFHYTQTLSGLPDGQYTLTCQMVNGEGQNTGYVYATSGDATLTATVSQSCAGSNFDAQRDRMAASASYALLGIDIDVVGGTLTFGIREPSANTTWLVWDNFKLTYRGNTIDGIGKIAEDRYPTKGILYDLQGRRIHSVPKKRIYIKDGKMFIIK